MTIIFYLQLVIIKGAMASKALQRFEVVAQKWGGVMQL
jgi:hypothetical protein